MISHYVFFHYAAFSKEVVRFQQLEYDKLSPLHAAAGALKVNVVELLLRAGADVNNQSRWSLTPLLSALESPGSSSQSRDTLACLIMHGANVNYRDADGMTPLMYAAKFCKDAYTVQVLIKADADPYAMDIEGFTALHHCCQSSCADIFKHLLEIAPDLLLFQGKTSLAACPAPYLAVFEASVYTDIKDPLMKSILDNLDCPLAIKFDLLLLRIAYDFLRHGEPTTTTKFIETVIDPMSKALEEARISLPRDVVKVKAQVKLLELIKFMAMDYEDLIVMHKAVLSCCLSVVLSCFRFSSVEAIKIFYHWLAHFIANPVLQGIYTASAGEPLSRMLCFRLESIQYICISRRSLKDVFNISEGFITLACKFKVTGAQVLLNPAINVFKALSTLMERISICVYRIHEVLRSCSKLLLGAILKTQVQFGLRKASSLMAKFAKCNPPPLVNEANGYPESLLHIVLSYPGMLISPLLETFLEGGGNRWINTPGGVNGYRPLHGVPKQVKVLFIEHGAHLDAVDAYGSTPKCCQKYYLSHPRPLSCIVASSIVKSGGLMVHEIGLLPTHMQAFVSLHDWRAARAQIDNALYLDS